LVKTSRWNGYFFLHISNDDDDDDDDDGDDDDDDDDGDDDDSNLEPYSRASLAQHHQQHDHP
jgi:hypothetical protein